MIPILPDWMYHTIEESFTSQFTVYTANGMPLALPVFLHHFDPDNGICVLSSDVSAKRIENVHRNPKVALLFSPTGERASEPPHVLLVHGRAEVDDSDPEHAWERYFAGWARRQPSARQSLQKREQMPEYWRRVIIRVRLVRLTGWKNGDYSQAADVVEVNP